MSTLDRTPVAPRVPLGIQVADTIREEIAREGLPEGSELPSESKLAQRFGVSARVIRDALRNLDSQGVIQTRQGKRAVVSLLRPVGVENYFKFAVEADAQSIEQLLELRLLLEVPAARLAAARATPEQISRLKRLLLDLEDSGTQLDQRVPADIALHSAIAEMSGNTFLHGILQSMTSVLSEERRYGGEIRQAMGSVHADSDHRHEDLVAAIEHHDEVAAEEAARGIVLAARESFIRGD